MLHTLAIKQDSIAKELKRKGAIIEKLKTQIEELKDMLANVSKGVKSSENDLKN